MKKRILGFAVIAAIVMSLASCAVKVEDEIVGTWDDSLSHKVFQFNADGTAQYWFKNAPDVKTNFTWSIKGKKITVKSEKSIDPTFIINEYDISIKGDSMTWKYMTLEQFKFTKI